jgi:hypothetical protein
MPSVKIVFVTLLCLLSYVTEAQRTSAEKAYSRSRQQQQAQRAKGSKAQTICPVFDKSRYPFHGLGFKLGDPFAITYKFYLDKNFAVVADVGKASSGLYSGYFREKFTEYMKDTVTISGATLSPITHKVKADLIGEVKVLYHINASALSSGLQCYVGVGWEWKTSRITYDYVYETPGTPAQPTPSSSLGKFSVNRFTQGPQAVLGIEYSYFQIPVSAFMELEYFTDVNLDPGWARVEGGVGLRYIF